MSSQFETGIQGDRMYTSRVPEILSNEFREFCWRERVYLAINKRGKLIKYKFNEISLSLDGNCLVHCKQLDFLKKFYLRNLIVGNFRSPLTLVFSLLNKLRNEIVACSFVSNFYSTPWGVPWWRSFALL